MKALMEMMFEDCGVAEIRIGEWEEDDPRQSYYAEAYAFDPDGVEKGDEWVDLASVYGAETIHFALIELAEKLVAPKESA